jgi:hypothetical protein
MSSIFGWIKRCFNHYVIGEIKDELINKINDNNNIDVDTKKQLKDSIITNNSTQLMKDLNDENIRIADETRAELIGDIMRASQMYCNPMEIIPQKINNVSMSTTAHNRHGNKTYCVHSQIKLDPNRAIQRYHDHQKLKKFINEQRRLLTLTSRYHSTGLVKFWCVPSQEFNVSSEQFFNHNDESIYHKNASGVAWVVPIGDCIHINVKKKTDENLIYLNIFIELQQQMMINEKISKMKHKKKYSYVLEDIENRRNSATIFSHQENRHLSRKYYSNLHYIKYSANKILRQNRGLKQPR